MADTTQGSNPVFTEMLKMEIDLSSFSQSLQKLSDMYEEKISKMGTGSASGLTGLVDKISAVFGASTKGAEDAGKAAETLALRVEGAKSQETAAVQRAEIAKTQVVSAQSVLRDRVESGASAAKIAAAEKVVQAASQLEVLRTDVAQRYSSIRVAIEQQANSQIVTNQKQAISAMNTQATAAATGLNRALTAQSKVDASASASFLGGLVSNLGTSVAFGLKLTAGMALFQLATQTALAPLHAMVDLFQSGWKHLSTMQQGAMELQSILLGSVKYSDDINKNYQLAGEAARKAQEQFHEFAAKSGVDEQKLQMAYKSYVQGGGPSLTQTSEQDVPSLKTWRWLPRADLARRLDEFSALKCQSF